MLNSKIGTYQIDLKVLGTNKTGVGKLIYVFHMVEITTRVAFSMALESGHSNEMIKALNCANEYFRSLSLPIDIIQTGNATMIKESLPESEKQELIFENNFVKSLEYSDWCDSHDIMQQLIKPKQPQQNGRIKQYHSNMDHELSAELLYCKTIEQVAIVIDDYYKYHNNERYHNYKELKNLPTKERYMKPVEAVKYYEKLNGLP